MYRDPAQYKSFMVTYYQKRRKLIFAKLGNVCQICGLSNKLQVCSKNPHNSTKSNKLHKSSNQIGAVDSPFRRQVVVVHFNLSNLWSMPIDRLGRTLPMCQLLCRQHRVEQQKAARITKGVEQLKHGAYYAYWKKKCRCEECEEYHSDQVLRRREDRRDRVEADSFTEPQVAA